MTSSDQPPETKTDENSPSNTNHPPSFTQNPSTTINQNNNKQPHLPLQYSWTLWHTAPEQGGGWNEHYKQIARFSTVEEFWRLFNNISPPSLLSLGSSYHLFKGKVRPAWEDSFNKDGGAWAFRFSNFEGNSNMGRGRGRGGRRGRGGHGRGRGRGGGRYGGNGGGGGRGSDPLHAANYAWYHNVLNMIGNNFSYSEDICGLIINIKKAGKGKIELWIKDAGAIEKVMEIGRQFKDFSFSGPSKKASTDIEFLVLFFIFCVSLHCLFL